jgi:hypothetical protein
VALRKNRQQPIRRGTNLFDLLVSAQGSIDPAEAKIHLATVNRAGVDPLEVFLNGKFQEWQAIQSKLNFKLPYVVSLIKIARNRWLFAGVYSIDQSGTSVNADRHYKIKYKTRREMAGAEFIGRLIVKFERPGRMPYLLGENCADNLLVDELRAEPVTADDVEFMQRSPEVQPLDEFAARILRALVQHVFDASGEPLRPITYEGLAVRLNRRTRSGRPQPLGMGDGLTKMGRALAALEIQGQQEIPEIHGIVVNKSGRNRNLPGAGIELLWPDFWKLTRAERETRVRYELARVEEFGTRWNDVLRKLQLPPARATAATSAARRFGSGSESPEHKALKLFVRDNPERIGVGKNCRATVEYVLPSLDQVDVYFQGDDECVAVEVKSKVSDRVTDDYERGIYQAIKYLALLNAMSQVEEHGICGKVRAMLVLETALPAQMRALAKRLSVNVIENIVPDAKYLARVKRFARRG